MRKSALILLTSICILLTACGNNAPKQVEAPSQKTAETTAPATESIAAEGDTLVVYFSRMGNTDFPDGIDAKSSASLVVNDGSVKGNAQLMAEWIADEEGCDTYEILTEEKYPVDYRETTTVAKNEQNDKACPSLTNHIDDIDSYSKIYIVYPNWWGDLPQAVYSFFDEYDMSGKTVIPFVTHGGSSFSNTISTIKSLEPDAEVIQGLSVRDSSVSSSETEIREWVRNNGGNENE